MAEFRSIEVVIPSGSTTSGAIPLDVDGSNRLFCLKAIIFPAAMTGSTITYNVATSAEKTPVPLNGVSTSVVIGQAVPLDAGTFAAFRWIEFISSSAEAADRTIEIVLYDV